MIEPTRADIGRKVIYRDVPGRKIAEGKVSSFNEHFVFVRFGKGTTGQPTPRDRLTWSTRQPHQTAVWTLIRGGQCIDIGFCEPNLLSRK